MPRFYIDTFGGDEVDLDLEGMDLLDADTARLAAVAALPDMARDAHPGGDNWRVTVAVRNAVGSQIYTATLTMQGRWTKSSIVPWPTSPASP